MTTATKTARAVIDYGNQIHPRWGDHVANLSSAYPAQFDALKKLATGEKSLKELVEFFEDYAEHISAEGKAGPAILAAWRKCTLSHTKTMNGEIQDLEISATATERLTLGEKDSAPPVRLTLTSPLVEGLTDRDIVFVISPAAADKLVFRVRIIAEAIHREASAKELVDLIRAEFVEAKQPIPVYIGTAITQQKAK